MVQYVRKVRLGKGNGERGRGGEQTINLLRTSHIVEHLRIDSDVHQRSC